MGEHGASIGRIGAADPATPGRAPPDFVAGEALVQPALNRIRMQGRTVQVEPKVMQVLLLMAARPGHVVGREAFMDTVWAGSVGDDYLLNRAISELRRIFGDDAQAPHYIETIRKGGYRLVAPLAPARAALAVDDAMADGDGRAPSTAATPELSAAVDQEAPAAVVTPPRRHRWPAVAASCALALLAGAAWLALRTPQPGPGLRVEPLTSFVGREMQPALSPDGSRVAFVWDAGGGQEVYVKTVGGAEALNLSRSGGDDHHPLWLPDGRGVLYAQVDGQGLSVMHVPATGGGARRVLRDPSVDGLRGMGLSPDGARLVYAARERAEAPYRLVLAALDGSGRRVLSQPRPGTLGDMDPRFSPDGRTVAFVRAVNEVTRDVYRTTPGGSAPMRLTFDNRKINGLAWTPDGHRLLFTSTRSGTYALWSLDPDRGGLRRLPLDHEAVQQPATAPGVPAIVFEHWNHRSQLRLLDLATRREAPAGPFFRSTRWDSSPAWSPDGMRIAFGSNRGGPHAIWVSAADGAQATEVAGFGGAFIDNPAWSPDGTLIAFDASPDGTSAIYVVEAAGGRPRRITQGPADARHASWSRDGTWLYFETLRNGRWRMQARRMADDARVELGPGLYPRESGDGRWLLYARPDADGLWRQPRRDWSLAASDPPERVPVPLRAGDAARWTTGAAAIYFVRRVAGGPPRLSLFDPDRGQASDLLELPEGFEGSGLAVSPDEARLLYAEPLAHESDLRLALMDE